MWQWTYLKSLYLELKALGQCGCEQWKGFSPVWLKVWSRSLSCEVNRAPHTKHSFPLATTSSLSALSLTFPPTFSFSLPIRGSGTVLPNTLAAVRWPSSSGVSVVIWCEASAAAAAMAALECRCHENWLVDSLPCRVNAGSCVCISVSMSSGGKGGSGGWAGWKRGSQEGAVIKISRNLWWDRRQMLWSKMFPRLQQEKTFVSLKAYLYLLRCFSSSFACLTPLLHPRVLSYSPSPNSQGWWWVWNTALHFDCSGRTEQEKI